MTKKYCFNFFAIAYFIVYNNFMNNNYYIYILSSENNSTIYVGVTNNLIRRVYEHKNNMVEGFTKKYNVHKLVYFEKQAMLTQQLQEKNK